MWARLLLAASVAATPLVLGGCVAAAVPVLAGSLLAKKQIDDDDAPGAKGKTDYARQPRAAGGETPAAPTKEHRPRERRRVSQTTVPPAEPLPARLRPIAANEIPLPEAGAGAAVPLRGLTALPSPFSAPGSTLASGGAAFPAFARYALAAARPQPGQPFRSALIDPATLAAAPVRGLCAKQPPAVLIDLDPEKGAFDLDDPPAAAPDLAEQLAALRAGGLVVLWQASLPAAQSERLYSTLAATGLDLDRTDRLLLQRKADERKQARRNDAARDWCILAIAGDSKGDFEEAFLYLRDQNGPIAQALGANLGEGWFLTPQPIN